MPTRSTAGRRSSRPRARPGRAGRSRRRLDVAFGVTVKATADPGVLAVQTEQRYPDGGVVSRPVSLTVVPAAESPSENLALAGVVGLIGLLVVAAVAMLAWRRRS